MILISFNINAQTKVYEIINKGKGVITEIAPADLLLIRNDTVVSVSDATKEDVSNKDNGVLSTSATTYPTSGAVKTYVESQLVTDNIANNASFSLGDNVSEALDILTDAVGAKQDGFTVTTTGTNGPATFFGNVLNIPNYTEVGNVKTTGNQSIDGVKAFFQMPYLLGSGFRIYDSSLEVDGLVGLDNGSFWFNSSTGNRTIDFDRNTGLSIYGSSASKGTIDSNSLTSDRTFSLPNKNGILATTSDFKTINGESIVGTGDLEITAGGSTNTTFQEVTYSSTISHAFDSANPNIFINVTGNLDLTYTGTANGDSGMVNLYFAGTQAATINGTKSLNLTGDSTMIPIYFVHDDTGIRWYDGRDTGGTVDTSNLAVQDGTILYHTAVSTDSGTFSNVGNVCTGTGTDIKTTHIGSKIKKANGEEAIIATRTSSTEFTTVEPFLTNSVDTAFEVRNAAIKVKPNGSIVLIGFQDGDENIELNPSASAIINGITAFKGGVTQVGPLDVTGFLKTNPTYYASEAAAIADTGLESNSVFRVTGSNVLYIKP